MAITRASEASSVAKPKHFTFIHFYRPTPLLKINKKQEPAIQAGVFSVRTSHIVKCNVPNMYAPYTVHYTKYAYVAVYNPNQAYTALHSPIQDYTTLYSHIQAYTGKINPILPYTSLYSPMQPYTAYTVLYSLFNPIPVYTSIYDTMQPYNSPCSPILRNTAP